MVGVQRVRAPVTQHIIEYPFEQKTFNEPFSKKAILIDTAVELEQLTRTNPAKPKLKRRLFTNKCKLKAACSYFTPESETCMFGPHNYCGKYREAKA